MRKNKKLLKNDTIQNLVTIYKKLADKDDEQEQKKDLHKQIKQLIETQSYYINAELMYSLIQLNCSDITHTIISLPKECFSLHSEWSSYAPFSCYKWTSSHESTKLRIETTGGKSNICILAIAAKSGYLRALDGFLYKPSIYKPAHLHQTLVMLCFYRPQNKTEYDLYVKILNTILKHTKPTQHGLSKLSLKWELESHGNQDVRYETLPFYLLTGENLSDYKKEHEVQYYSDVMKAEINLANVTAITVAALFVNLTALRALSKFYMPSDETSITYQGKGVGKASRFDNTTNISAITIISRYTDNKGLATDSSCETDIPIPSYSSRQLVNLNDTVDPNIQNVKIHDHSQKLIELSRNTLISAERYIHSSATTMEQTVALFFSRILTREENPLPEAVLFMIASFLDAEGSTQYKMILENEIPKTQTITFDIIQKSKLEVINALNNLSTLHNSILSKKFDCLFIRTKTEDTQSGNLSTATRLRGLLSSSHFLISELNNAENTIAPPSPAYAFLQQLTQISLQKLSDIMDANIDQMQTESNIQVINQNIGGTSFQISGLSYSLSKDIKTLCDIDANWKELTKNMMKESKTSIALQLCEVLTQQFSSQTKPESNGTEESKIEIDEAQITIEFTQNRERQFSDLRKRFGIKQELESITTYLSKQKKRPLELAITEFKTKFNTVLENTPLDIKILEKTAQQITSLPLLDQAKPGNRLYHDLDTLTQIFGIFDNLITNLKERENADTILQNYSELVSNYLQQRKAQATSTSTSAPIDNQMTLTDILQSLEKQPQMKKPRGLFNCAGSHKNSKAGETNSRNRQCHIL